jgi:hypothetical protein
MEIKYSTIYAFPSHYKWKEFLTEGVYIFLTNRRQQMMGAEQRTVYTPFYVGQSSQIGPELLNHYYGSSNQGLTSIFKSHEGDVYVVYASVKDENTRRAVEAFLISTYRNRGFTLANVQILPFPPSFSVNVF